MSKIKLISSWTRPGGGTVAHINLTNLLNDNGFDCTFYGPHEWHLDKCKGALLKDTIIEPDDIIISHFVQISPDVKFKKHILYCHEKDLFPLQEINLSQYDLIVFVSNAQKQWHSVNHPSVIIPPLVKKVNWTNPNNGVAGVIGSVDRNKQTHKSIQRAISHGFSSVKLFGEVNDQAYFRLHVEPILHNNNNVILAGHQDDPEVMYGQISTAYHSSLSETFGLVEAECRLAGIPFNGPSNNQEILDEKEILKRWKKVLPS
tara:strand:+ start:359 stop:1138 length:780 start_codon:yes stop_codon:yes gene_type:complete